MSKHKRLLQPTGNFPKAGIVRRLAAMFYDFLLVVSLVIVVAGLYQQVVLRLIYGSEKLTQLSEAGMLDRDPVLASILIICIFAFFAKFWTHNGQTLGMQVWGIRVQNADGSAIDLWQALLRFVIGIISWLPLGLGYWWCIFSKNRSCWHDNYSETVTVQLPKNVHKK